MPPVYRSALVTGASSGIGEAVARELARRGSSLVVVARRADLLDRLARELGQGYGVGVEVLPADLTDPAALATVEQRLSDAQRPIDLLVNNAGFATTGDFASLPVAGEDAEIRLNALAVSRLTHAALPGMLERRHGGILNVASMAGWQPLPGAATYAATKAFVIAFSESVHGEVRPHGVHVTVLCPGYVDVDPDGPTARSLPASLVWSTPERVARESLDAVERGRAVYVPGITFKTVGTVVRLLPKSAVRALTTRIRSI